MDHDWQFSDGENGSVVECLHCGLVYQLNKTRPTYGCKGTRNECSYAGNNNRVEPSEEILRQLGHGFTTGGDV